MSMFWTSHNSIRFEASHFLGSAKKITVQDLQQSKCPFKWKLNESS